MYVRAHACVWSVTRVIVIETKHSHWGVYCLLSLYYIHTVLVSKKIVDKSEVST